MEGQPKDLLSVIDVWIEELQLMRRTVEAELVAAKIDLHAATDEELARRYERAWQAEDDETASEVLNLILERLDLPLDWTEQGLNDKANAALDEFLRKHGVTVLPY